VENAVRLCRAQRGFIFRANGELYELAVDYNAPPAFKEWTRDFPIRAGDGSVVGRVARERRTVQIHDAQVDKEWRGRNVGAPGIDDVRTLLGVPMLREGTLIGVFAMWRAEGGALPDKHVELVTTFADQAVIAIENVRLLQELQARTRELGRSVEELTALGEVSRAVTATLDVDAVLQTVVSRAAQLASADGGSIFEYEEATEDFRLRATHNYEAELTVALRAMPIRMGEGMIGRAAEVREPMQVPDIVREGAYQSRFRDILLRMGYRAMLAVPLVREDQVIGALAVHRKVPEEFSPEVIELLRTFATQSALAIQNARLFPEIEDNGRH